MPLLLLTPVSAQLHLIGRVIQVALRSLCWLLGTAGSAPSLGPTSPALAVVCQPQSCLKCRWGHCPRGLSRMGSRRKVGVSEGSNPPHTAEQGQSALLPGTTLKPASFPGAHWSVPT